MARFDEPFSNDVIDLDTLSRKWLADRFPDQMPSANIRKIVERIPTIVETGLPIDAISMMPLDPEGRKTLVAYLSHAEFGLQELRIRRLLLQSDKSALIGLPEDDQLSAQRDRIHALKAMISGS